MKTIPVLVLAFTFTSIAMPPASADEPITLRFAMTSPQAGWSWQKWFGPRWIPAVENASGGALKIQPYFGVTLANMLNAYDRTVNGVADLAYSVTGTMRGKFPKTNVVELPNDSNGREASGALWKLYESGLTAAEWSDTVPLYLYVYSQSVFHFQKPVTKLEDIKGMKIGATSKVTADTIERLGAAPITTSPAEMYEVLQRRTINGMAMGWNGVLSFKLQDVTNYHVNVQLGSGVHDPEQGRLREAARQGEGGARCQLGLRRVEGVRRGDRRQRGGAVRDGEGHAGADSGVPGA